MNYYTPVVALTAAVGAAADTQHDGVSGEKTHDSHIKPEASFGGGVLGGRFYGSPPLRNDCEMNFMHDSKN